MLLCRRIDDISALIDSIFAPLWMYISARHSGVDNIVAQYAAVKKHLLMVLIRRDGARFTARFLGWAIFPF